MNGWEYIFGAGGVVAALGGVIRYMFKEYQKQNQETMKEHRNQIESQAQTFMAYIQEKNGHLERISTSFAATINDQTNQMRDNTQAVRENTQKINDLIQARKKR